MSTEVHYFCSTAGQFEDTPFNGETPSNMVVIRFMLFRQVGSQSIDAPEDQIAWDEIKRDWHTEILAELLSNEIGVPDVKQPTIINQIFQAVELADIPGVPVTSIISDATIPYYAALSWPMLLAVSAGGVIAAVLLCRLLKRS
ncbi:hypothetical protein M0R45_010433 [Rubus argutus]|uniref:Uncharacterized protein n=1 Tax=Rubus argutus TaxID=59490 RepID=A0AAW1Y8T5_RUBAR